MMTGQTDPGVHQERMLYHMEEENKMKSRAAYQIQLIQADQVAYKKHCQENHPENTMAQKLWIKKHGKYVVPAFKGPNKPRWGIKKDYVKCAIDDQNRFVGHGSYYKRAYGDYTWEELHARQGCSACVRTKDYVPFDRIQHGIDGDNSELESSWLDRTGHP